ncbi:hypothetical protein NC00_12305 [Xanthomonas cannabis pv. phaseoli]|uniref:Uncharacterized protein n=1 Tax=Xanthomonas cannabis pv. phaseoli TaxID=1885902 RepID=A0AB34P807_9XANT|nr:hypothetical protein NC00_12305 [Xanthomonas cannabis pv. phaseoli]PPU27894.1 hypothetical protein XspCFBP7912_20725 [Xanthomonas sp. CFBP 7912]RJS01709.1 hypothetical protein XnspCFBP7698_20795 [Xanthomonas sp. CFBP 7698]
MQRDAAALSRSHVVQVRALPLRLSATRRSQRAAFYAGAMRLVFLIHAAPFTPPMPSALPECRPLVAAMAGEPELDA